MTVVLLSKSLASVAAVGLMAVWMTPSTKPKPSAPSPLAGLAPVKPMELPPETVGAAARAAMPPPSLIFHTLPAETSRVTEDPPLAVVAVKYDDQSLPPPARQNVDVPATATAGRVEEGDEGRIRYRAGYSWAKDHSVEEAQDCPSSSGDPARQGCLDYASDQDRTSGDGNY